MDFYDNSLEIITDASRYRSLVAHFCQDVNIVWKGEVFENVKGNMKFSIDLVPDEIN